MSTLTKGYLERSRNIGPEQPLAERDEADPSTLHETRAERIIEATQTRKGCDINHCTFLDVIDTLCERRGIRTDDHRERVQRGLGIAEGVAALASVIYSAILAGTTSVRNTVSDWVTYQPLQNYRPHELGTPTVLPRVGTIARGDSATGGLMRVDSQQSKLAHFGLAFSLDEQDILDQRTIGALTVPLVECGKALGRLVPDLVYSELLGNPTLDRDGVTVFHASRGNLVTTALADASLDAGVAAIGKQTLPDEDGRPVHLGLQPATLVVPPDLAGTSRKLIRDRMLGDDADLKLVSDSRLSDGGLVDPRTDETVTGTTTNWLLVARPEDRPAIVVSTLDGRPTPRLQQWQHDGGQWGLGFALDFACSVSIIDPLGLYWSTGAA